MVGDHLFWDDEVGDQRSGVKSELSVIDAFLQHCLRRSNVRFVSSILRFGIALRSVTLATRKSTSWFLVLHPLFVSIFIRSIIDCRSILISMPYKNVPELYIKLYVLLSIIQCVVAGGIMETIF